MARKDKREMKRCLVGLIAVSLGLVGGCQLGPRVEFVRGSEKVDVTIGGKDFTSYLYGGSTYEPIEGADNHDKGFLPKPVLYPVLSPSGTTVTRAYPLGYIEDEVKDHPHHVGVFFTYDQINSNDFWGNTGTSPQIKHVKVTKTKAGLGKGGLSTMSHWVGETGQVLLEERRSMTFIAGKDEYAIDFDIILSAKDTSVLFEDTKEGMLAIRVAEWLREAGGTGEYLSSDGNLGPVNKNIWGRRARWVRLQGQTDDQTIGVAIFNHPSSINYPTYWHARPYGLFAANPLGQYVFEKKYNPERAEHLNLTLEPGQTAHFRFLLLIYEGARTRDEMEQRFDKFAR
jgi:hypothetical protein